ncbi:MAG: hypothetical protein ACYTHK_01080 [Planctomycetota bacterium]|jgi:hypothetical protein
MKSAYDAVLEKVKPGAELRTPDAASGKPFRVDSIDSESVTVRTARGGRVKMSLFTFDSAVKYLEDVASGDGGGDWLPVKDEMFQAVLNMENDRVRASSYIIAILGAAGLIEIDGRRPNRVKLVR